MRLLPKPSGQQLGSKTPLGLPLKRFARGRKLSLRRWRSFGFDCRGRAGRQPSRIPAEYVSSQACNEEFSCWGGRDHMTRTLHGPNNLAGFHVDPHDSTRQRVVGDVLDVVAVSDHPHFVFRGDEQSLRRSQMGPLL